MWLWSCHGRVCLLIQLLELSKIAPPIGSALVTTFSTFKVITDRTIGSLQRQWSTIHEACNNGQVLLPKLNTNIQVGCRFRNKWLLTTLLKSSLPITHLSKDLLTTCQIDRLTMYKICTSSGTRRSISHSHFCTVGHCSGTMRSGITGMRMFLQLRSKKITNSSTPVFDCEPKDDKNGRSPTQSSVTPMNKRLSRRKQDKERMRKDKGGEYKEVISRRWRQQIRKWSLK